MANKIQIEVVQGQSIRQLEVPCGATISDVLGDQEYEAVGIFGALRTPNHVLEQGDRIEVYKPLLIEPKEARRLRAIRDNTKTHDLLNLPVSKL